MNKTVRKDKITDLNVLDGAAFSCMCVNKGTYIGNALSEQENESLPETLTELKTNIESELVSEYNSESELSSNESSFVSESEWVETESYNHVYDSSPEDVIIPESEKIDESDIISGETYDEDIINVHSIGSNKSEWSATETINNIVDRGPKVNNNAFQNFIREMIQEKCWSDEDVAGFAESMAKIKDLAAATDRDKQMELLLNPKYYDTIHDILDRLDTINAVCVMGSGNKCNMIKNQKHRETMKKQVALIGRVVDIYTPIFIRILLLIENFTKDLTEAETCELDPEYLHVIRKLKDRIVGSLYMRRLSGVSGSTQQNKILREMTNQNGQFEGPGAESLEKPKINVQLSDTTTLVDSKNTTVLTDGSKEGFSTCTTYRGDYFMTIIMILISIVIIYLLVSKK